MCGRYQLDPDTSDEIMKIIQQVGDRVKTGEIYPTNPVPILMEDKGTLAPEVAVWGYPRFTGKPGSIINARSETALERPMFKKSVLERRCVLPATGFFEWGKTEEGKKHKYRFRIPGQSALYLAGLWNDFAGQRRCVILTSQANASIQEIHDRMPLLMDQEDICNWVQDTNYAMEFLQKTPPALSCERAD